MVHAFISSRLDYCNTWLVGVPDCHLNKLQRLQNSAARVITFTRKREHITPVLYDLHWLRVRQRIMLKIFLLTDKALNGKIPAYISEMLSFRDSRSSHTWTLLLFMSLKSIVLLLGVGVSRWLLQRSGTSYHSIYEALQVLGYSNPS